MGLQKCLKDATNANIPPFGLLLKSNKARGGRLTGTGTPGFLKLLSANFGGYRSSSGVLS